MLTPEYLSGVSDNLQAIYSELETSIMADIAKRISKTEYITDTAKFQLTKLEQIGLSQQYIQEQIAKTLKISNKEAARLFKEAGIKSMNTDLTTQSEMIKKGLLPADMLPLSASASFTQVINANLVRTANTLQKLTGTIAQDASGKLNQYLDESMLMVQSGSFTQQQAVNTAVTKFASDGVAAFDYVSGSRISVEAGVRRCTVTGVNQATAEVSLNNATELNTNLVEVSSHADARPEHAEWQGQVYMVDGSDSTYDNLADATGYGDVTGLCGANCRHSFWPYVEGVSDSIPKETYDPQTYQDEQVQRTNERKIREYKKRAATLEASGADATKANAKVKEWQGIQREHIKSTGLTREYGREKIIT